MEDGAVEASTIRLHSCRVRVAVRLRPKNSDDLAHGADFDSCVELQPEVEIYLEQSKIKEGKTQGIYISGATEVDVFIRKMNSIPAFTSNLTMESFNKRSIC
ncbi:uncharacterized protein LOC102712023 isoform X2 [Oryza brachyantha]|uniref:uncharacterized protein LOC102712023 isoform X2 n=1 Tax=Oryza brachyantha TaxID=4533 RepID=UPI0007763A55|nr:uncharacterized protein LOC102712023 isoform X2 [Oryza brachyantha]